MDHNEILVFDTGPLRHFATNGWLGALKAVVGGRQAFIPDTVITELRRSASADSSIQTVLEADWLEHRALQTAEELAAFGRFAGLLVRGTRNVGEAGVLALAAVSGGTAVIDDGAARQAARVAGVPFRPTLALLCEAIRDGLLTVSLVSALVDDLLGGSYRLPFRAGDFAHWAADNGLLDQPEVESSPGSPA
ncbi:nucleotide-binding protein [Frankia tisae]|uniref:nucleotide-binding protein n=1 Tax=Frankia tisae TaxID=2950104 RepID=UPI0021BFBD8B|nr:nucleotide-binding protein [Frankia tisae]